MRRPTGPGRVSEFDFVDSDLVLTANLYNYDIDGDDLKPEHKKFLQDRVADYLVKYGFHIWLHGHTSRSGDYAYNVGLSKRRAEGVAAYLRSLGVPAAQIQAEWDGPRSATPKVLEAEIDRSVSFHVQPGLTPRPPHVPPIIPVTDDFRIRIVGEPAMNRPNTVLAEYFQIWDFQNGLAAYYEIPGDFPRPEPSLNQVAARPFKGPWNLFHVVAPCPVTFFEGPTRMTRLSIARSPELRHVEVSLPLRYFSPGDGIVSQGSVLVLMDTGQFALWGMDRWDMRLTPKVAEKYTGP
jgi:hypothetical protein